MHERLFAFVEDALSKGRRVHVASTAVPGQWFQVSGASNLEGRIYRFETATGKLFMDQLTLSAIQVSDAE